MYVISKTTILDAFERKQMLAMEYAGFNFLVWRSEGVEFLHCKLQRFAKLSKNKEGSE